MAAIGTSRTPFDVDGSDSLLSHPEESYPNSQQNLCSSSHSSNTMEQDKLEPIAIIGFSAKFPQDATSPQAFWQMLKERKSAMTEVPEDRFNIESFYHKDTNRLDRLSARGGHFLKGDLSAFDAPFFSISSNEAVSMDPQQRGLLEESYRALENAGISMEQAAGSKTGVYVGTFTKEYDVLLSRDPDYKSKYQASGTGSAMLANRLSWFYNFKGPSVTSDTACSGSLVALHLACLGLRSRDATMGLVAGCNLILNPDTISIPLSNLNFLSPDSRCYSFDHRANGYSRGEGFGVVVIKLLSEALQDGNTIRAIIRGTGTNQDGRTPGITQPSKDAQETLIRDTYRSAGLDFQTTRFFEAHATGTPIGDPTEAGAIGAVFKDQRPLTDPLIVGAVKSNIGHLEGASGLASLIKTIMILEKGVIPPNIWFERPNQNIPVDEWNLKFPLENTPWPIQGLRRASVNSFGYGGANAHVVLDDAYHYMRLRSIDGKHCSVESPAAQDTRTSGLHEIKDSSLKNGRHSNSQTPNAVPSQPYEKLLVWTAADEAGLKRLAKVYHDYLTGVMFCAKAGSADFLQDLAYTLSSKRGNFAWKYHLVCRSIEDLVKLLDSGLPKPIRSSGEAPALGFVFTGQGAQWYAMGREMFSYAIFRDSLGDADNFLRSLGCPWSLIDELHRDKELSNVHDAEYSQPLCTALQMALVDTLASWNILPSAVVGHSSGEIAAAYCAGGLSRQSALKVAYFRGTLASRLAKRSRHSPGSMLATALSEGEVEKYFSRIAGKGDLAIGCVNSPTNSTVTGAETAINALKKILDREQIFARKLSVGVAYHSVQMNEVAEDYLALIQNLNSPEPSSNLPLMYSSVTGQRVSADQLRQSEYWVANMVSKVVFSDSLSLMCKSAGTLPKIGSLKEKNAVEHLIEIGPHSALQRPIQDVSGLGYTSALKINIPATQTMLDLAGLLRCLGYGVDLLATNGLVEKPHVRMLTDLPPYPFNHTQTYWHESRLSKNFRFRKHPPHELLGTPSSDWNPLEAKWRNTIKVAENPWVKDHKYSGSEIYPAAGMIVMAIEAARQVANSTAKKSIRGYRFKDVSFVKALVLSGVDEGVDTQFHLRPRKVDSSSNSEWSDFRLFMLSNNEWVENCHGTIITEYTEAEAEVDHGLEFRETKQRYKDAYARIADECDSKIDSRQMYEKLDALGASFGPTFQSLKDVCYSQSGKAIATIQLCEWMEKVSVDAKDIQQHVIHPTDLDGVFQLTIAAITRGGWIAIPTMVPTLLQSLWLSNDFLSNTSLGKLKVSSSSVSNGYREAVFDMLALSHTTHEPLIVVEGYRATAVTSIAGGSSIDSEWRRLCYSIDWKPDVDLLNGEQLSTICNGTVDSAQSYHSGQINETELVCLFFMKEALASVREEDCGCSKSNLRRYIEWMRHYSTQQDAIAIMSSSEGRKFLLDIKHREAVLNDFENSGPDGMLYVAVGRNLSRILRGEIDALDLLANGQLLQNFYSSSSFVANYKKISAYVDLLAHKNPNQSILEIGAGTGGATAAILRTLGPPNPQDQHGTPRYDHFTYTDISPGFFDQAKERFSNHGSRLLFKTLDIERDPQQQGFEPGKYDLVVASCVLHATSDIDTTLSNTRKLLKPGGKLILFEPCNLNCSRISFVFGLLPGWWLGSEDHRRWGPLLSDQVWNETLLKNEFSGADTCLRDHEGERHTFSVMTSTAMDKSLASPAVAKFIIVTAMKSPLQNVIAQRLRSQIQVTGLGLCECIQVHEIRHHNLERAFCVFMPEIEQPFLHEIQHQSFADLKHMVRAASKILWVSHDGGLKTQRPEMGLVTGFGRSLCLENSNLKFITMSLETISSIDKIVDYIVKIAGAAIVSPQWQAETEYMERDGVLCINRAVEFNVLNDKVFSEVVPQEPEMRKFGQQPERALDLTIASPGLLDTLRFVDDTVDGPLAPEEIEIRVRAVGMNFKNVMVALGQLPDRSLGIECAGVVTRVGQNVHSGEIQIGQRVCCVTHGAFKTYARSHTSRVHRIPDNMPFTTAAALPVAFCTVYYAFHHVGRLRKGESILIHAAAGGVGQAAIQLARLIGARIYVTVGSDEKKRMLRDLYNIPEDHIFSSRNLSFAHGIKRVTNGRGVDVVLNSLSGESLRQSLECVAPLGRFLEIGKQDMYLHRSLPMSPFLHNISFASIDLSIVIEQARPLMTEIMKDVMALVATHPSRVHAPKPLHVFKVSEVESAFRFLQSGKNAGKTVIEILEDDLVPIMPGTRPSWYFDENATYVISGGLGGLGRSIALWMASRNAKHLVLLSRSGHQGEAAVTLFKELEKKGVEVAAPPCDIGDESALVSVLDQYSTRANPIKGCVQASMVVKGSLFENMTIETFNAALRPKVRGSWNLNAHLPKGMDFFVLLSSVAGVIGLGGLSNYAAGNTYQDSLARYRVSQGEKCASLNLGLMLEVGFVAERQQLTDSLRATGYEGIRQAEFFAILDHFCNPNRPLGSPAESQVVTGISTQASTKSKRMAEIYWMSKPLFRNLVNADRTPSNSTEASKLMTDNKSLLGAADSLSMAGAAIEQALIKKLSGTLLMPENDIEVSKPMFAYGVDSLVTVEIRNWFLKEFKSEIPVFNILRSGTISELCLLVARNSDYVQASLKMEGTQ